MTIKLDIDVGDVVLGGKFKNKRMVVKKIGKDELNQPTINDKGLLKMRIEKDLPKEKQSKETREKESIKEDTMKITKQQLKQLLESALKIKENVAQEAFVEAEVWGVNSANADKKHVAFTFPKPIRNLSEIEDEAVRKFFEEGGYGDDPQIAELIIDGQKV